MAQETLNIQAGHYCSLNDLTWRIVAISGERIWLEETRNHQVVWVPRDAVKETWEPRFHPGDVVLVQQLNTDGVVASVHFLMNEKAYNVAVGNELVRCREVDLALLADELHEETINE